MNSLLNGVVSIALFTIETQTIHQLEAHNHAHHRIHQSWSRIRIILTHAMEVAFPAKLNMATIHVQVSVRIFVP